MHLKAGGEGLREGGGGEERVEEEVVGCCSGYVLRNHQLMQRKRKGLVHIRSVKAHQSIQLKCTLHYFM